MVGEGGHCRQGFGIHVFAVTAGYGRFVRVATVERVGARPVVRAAGGIVLRAASHGGWEVVLVHRRSQQDWSLPKGKLGRRESAESCALREVREETGLRCVLDRYAGEVRYRDRRGRDKLVEYWLMQPVGGRLRACEEVDQQRWLSPAQAIKLLSYAHDRDLLGSVGNPLAALFG
jgi:8-oxo-dGTP pyrophosphatase MutT (NUDIX family)